MRDDLFVRGEVPMTKMEVRGTIVGYLSLKPGQNVLEIGAGTGSCTVQMLKSCPDIQLTAVERSFSACKLIEENLSKHGVKARIVQGEAPDLELLSLEQWDAVFIGGSGSRLESIMKWLEDGRLKPGATLVFSAITLESIQEIFTYVNGRYNSIEGSQLCVSRLEALGKYHYFKPLNPCTVIKCIYGGENV